MRILAQTALIVAVLLVAVRLLRSSGMRALAVRRVGLIVLAGFAVVTIILPDTWTAIAALVGIGRGTDLLLYALVVAFLSYTATSYVRFRQLESAYTRLARRLALDEVPPPDDPARGDGQQPSRGATVGPGRRTEISKVRPN